MGDNAGAGAKASASTSKGSSGKTKAVPVRSGTGQVIKGVTTRAATTGSTATPRTQPTKTGAYYGTGGRGDDKLQSFMGSAAGYSPVMAFANQALYGMNAEAMAEYERLEANLGREEWLGMTEKQRVDLARAPQLEAQKALDAEREAMFGHLKDDGPKKATKAPTKTAEPAKAGSTKAPTSTASGGASTPGEMQAARELLAAQSGTGQRRLGTIKTSGRGLLSTAKTTGRSLLGY